MTSRTHIEPRFVSFASRMAAAIMITSALAACGGEDAASAASSEAAVPRAVVLSPQDVAIAATADITSGVLLTGTLEPAERVAITAQVGGTINGLVVDRGSRVVRGQRLATIRAEGVRSQAAGAQAGIAAAEAQVVVARTQRDAMKRLFEAGAASRVDYQNAEAALAAAEAQLAAARAQAAAAGETAGFTTIEAPITGTVSARPVEPGEAVKSGDPIMTIVNTATLELAGRIPVDEAGAVRVGQGVEFRLDAFPGRVFRGTVARKDPAADPSSRQVGVFVRLANSNGEITAGQFARGQVTGDRIEGAVTIPSTAVQGTGATASVFVVENNRLVKRAVTTGQRDYASATIAITSGLRAGEQVLARPTPSVTDGQAVVLSATQRSVPTDTPSVAPAAGDTNKSR